MDDLVKLISNGKALFNLFSVDVISLASAISVLSPGTPFAVRGWGEAPRDVWLREYSEGREVFALGPLDNAV